MRHLDEGTIHAWLDGALDAEAEKKAEEHAARCTECAVAVADARGMIAAASRILTALDDVPAGVLPEGSRAMPHARTIAPGTRRWPVWTLRIAASIAVVATGTFMAVRTTGRARMAELDQKAASREELPPGVALKVTPAITPETTPSRSGSASAGAPAAPQPGAAGTEQQERALADKDGTASALRADTGKSPSFDAARQLAVSAPKNADVSSGGAAGGGMAAANATAPSGAPAPASVAAAPSAATADRLQAFAARPESTKGASADLEAKKDANAPAEQGQVAKSKSEPAAAPVAGRMTGLAAVSLPPGMRLVSQKQTKEDAGVVERRVYELRPGVQVVLAILEPALGGGADDRATSNNEMRDSARRKLLANMAGSDEAAGLNSIQWTDSTGAEFTLSGPIPLDSLRAVRSRLPTKVQRQ